MSEETSQVRMGRRGLRLGILAGAPGGGVSGFLAMLFWGLWSLVAKIIRGERLAASDPVTVEEALANVLFNAVFFGIIGGVMIGVVSGAVAGYFVRSDRAQRPRVGLRLGAVLFALIGMLFRPEDWSGVLAFVLLNALIGAIGGLIGDRLFSFLYGRGVGANA